MSIGSGGTGNGCSSALKLMGRGRELALALEGLLDGETCVSHLFSKTI